LHVNWAEAKVGTLAGTIVNTVADNLQQNNVGAALAAGANSIAAVAALDKLAESGGPGQSVIAEGLQGAEATLGIAPDQFLTLLMRGATYKRHRFTWTSSPNNFQKANTLRQIFVT
jgi:hypothetical protein